MSLASPDVVGIRSSSWCGRREAASSSTRSALSVRKSAGVLDVADVHARVVASPCPHEQEDMTSGDADLHRRGRAVPATRTRPRPDPPSLSNHDRVAVPPAAARRRSSRAARGVRRPCTGTYQGARQRHATMPIEQALHGPSAQPEHAGVELVLDLRRSPDVLRGPDAVSDAGRRAVVHHRVAAHGAVLRTSTSAGSTARSWRLHPSLDSMVISAQPRDAEHAPERRTSAAEGALPGADGTS